MKVEEYLKMIIDNVNLLTPGQIFTLKDVILGVYWSSLSNNDKMIIGKKFKALVNADAIDVRYASNKYNHSNNPVVYMKVRIIRPISNN